MEAVEINCGSWYLRALRNDDRVSDLPALADLSIEAPDEFIIAANAGWMSGTLFTWAVCDITTGELLSLITSKAGGPPLGKFRSGNKRSLDKSLPAVTRFLQSLG